MRIRLILSGLLCLAALLPASAGRTDVHAVHAARARLHHVRLAHQRSRLTNGGIGLRRAVGPVRQHAGRDPDTGAASEQTPSCRGLSGRSLTIATDKPVHIGLKTYPETLDLRDHEVVLTFDDGPSPATTPAVLDALRQECVKATFFLIGRNAAAQPLLVRRELAEGHTLGHHSMTHPSVTLRGLDERSAETEIDEGIAADETAAYGSDAAGAPRVPFFRFPGFADTKLLRELRTKGYKVVHLVPAGQGGEPSTVMEAPKGWSSETEAIIAHLRPNIAPGAHRRVSRDQASLAGAPRGRRRARTAAHANSRRT